MKSEEELIQSEKKYRNLFEDSMDMIFLTSYEGNFIDINQAGLDLLGYSREEISEMRVDSVYAIPSMRNEFRDIIAKTGSVRDFEIKLKRKDGSEIDGILSGTVRKSMEGKIIGYQGIIREITKRKQAEELIINKHELLLQANAELTRAHVQETELRSQLIKADRLASIGKMAAKIAHEINNPLAVIMGQSQIQLAKVKDLELKVSLEKIYSQAEEISQLTRRYMDLGKPVDTKMEGISLGEVLKKSVATLSGVGHLKLMKVSEDYSDKGYDIFGNTSMLEQVFRNLIMNAIHASSESLKKEISVGTRIINQGNKIEAFIEDKGIGIPFEDLGKIFEDYFTSKAESIGTGLGLAICKEIVETIHGGIIQVESEQGKGSRFRIIIPNLEFSLQKKKILIVDDEAYVGELFSEYLSTKGFLIQTCLSGMEALRLFSDYKPDLVLSDYEMPEMNGLELYEAIKEINPRQSFVMVTGAFIPPEELNLLRERHIKIIIKPAELENELLKIVIEQFESKPK